MLKKAKDSLTKLVNSLTTEQYMKMLEIADGPIPQEIRNMTDDELVKELNDEV